MPGPKMVRITIRENEACQLIEMLRRERRRYLAEGKRNTARWFLRLECKILDRESLGPTKPKRRNDA